MPARRKVSLMQMELLLEFAESHRDIALGRSPGGPQVAGATREAWESVALQLNSIRDGTTKKPDQWRRYWIEFKAKTKGKGADSRRNASTTGGGPNKLVPLNEMEKKVLALIGPVTVKRLRGVRLPCHIPSEDESEALVATTVTPSSAPHSSSSSSSSGSESIAPESIIKVERLDEEVPSLLQLESQIFTPPPSAVYIPFHSANIPTQNKSDGQPEVSSKENRQTRHCTSTSPPRSSRSQSHLPREERAPRWAYDIESRRIAAEERLAAAVDTGFQRLAAAVEEGVQLMREIRNDVHSYVHRLE